MRNIHYKQAHGELVVCLRCQKKFLSVCKKTNRICERCAKINAQLGKLECSPWAMRTAGTDMANDLAPKDPG